MIRDDFQKDPLLALDTGFLRPDGSGGMGVEGGVPRGAQKLFEGLHITSNIEATRVALVNDLIEGAVPGRRATFNGSVEGMY